jgi:hypothetical protein
MRLFATFLSVSLLMLLSPALFAQDEQYKLGYDSQPQDGVPKGTVTKLSFEASKIFPGTVRDYWVYVPAQYKPEGPPACLMVFQDGNGYKNPTGAMRVPIVFDNLIHKGEMPITVGVFVNPGGHKDRQREGQPFRADNRSFEYDTLSSDYARFLIEELLPEVEKQAKVKLTQDPDGRAICGLSSGGICAFTVAWERPDSFHKVVSHFGSFTSIAYRPGRDGQPMRPGGDLYPTLIRKTPIKPLKVFLQDGSHDLNNEHGDWFLANQQMLSALNFANSRAEKAGGKGPRYEVEHAWGEGTHNPAHGGSIFPDTMRWLWKGYKAPQ